MKIAATGLSGAVGQSFPTSVVSLVTRLENTEDQMQAELMNHPSVEGLIHLAALTLVKDCEQDPEKAFQMNVEGALKWFRAAGKTGHIKHFIFLSTSHVYGDPKTQSAFPPTHPVNPINIYGKTKVEAENRLTAEAQKFPHMKLTIARMFSVLSENAKPGLLYPNLHRRAQQKDFSPVPGLNYVRDFLWADQAVEKLLTLVTWTQAPPVVHISSGKGRTVLDLAHEVFQKYQLNAKELLTEAPKGASDVPYLVGLPTNIPSKNI